jgi:hypothetical protein
VRVVVPLTSGQDVPGAGLVDDEDVVEDLVAAEAAGGFADATFRDPTGWEAAVRLSLVLQQDEGAWRIRQYHVSRVSTEH